jgi:hypothetical protein
MRKLLMMVQCLAIPWWVLLRGGRMFESAIALASIAGTVLFTPRMIFVGVMLIWAIRATYVLRLPSVIVGQLVDASELPPSRKVRLLPPSSVKLLPARRKTRKR